MIWDQSVSIYYQHHIVVGINDALERLIKVNSIYSGNNNGPHAFITPISVKGSTSKAGDCVLIEGSDNGIAMIVYRIF